MFYKSVFFIFFAHDSGSAKFCRSWLSWLSVGMLALALGTPSAIAEKAAPDLVTVRMQKVTPHLNAYGRVAPTSVLPVNAAETGVVSGLKVLPGMHVRSGQVLAKLTGPGVQNLMLADTANLRSAKKQLANARKSLAIQKEQLRAHLSTREMVHQAESAMAKAESAEEDAESQLAAVRRMREITAPASGIVVSLESHDGELLQAGQPAVTLQTDGSLWLVATYYGGDPGVIHAGMVGRFKPESGGRAIPVKVAAILAPMTAGGGEQVALRALRGGVRWVNGEAGSVELDGRSRTVAMVPTRALILNRGKWWVMVHDAKGNHAVQVAPGPARGWDTSIRRGLKVGEQVVTVNAYLLFHAQVIEHYQIPD